METDVETWRLMDTYTDAFFCWNQPCILPTTVFVEAALFLMAEYEDL